MIGSVMNKILKSVMFLVGVFLSSDAFALQRADRTLVISMSNNERLSFELPEGMYLLGNSGAADQNIITSPDPDRKKVCAVYAMSGNNATLRFGWVDGTTCRSFSGDVPIDSTPGGIDPNANAAWYVATTRPGTWVDVPYSDDLAEKLKRGLDYRTVKVISSASKKDDSPGILSTMNGFIGQYYVGERKFQHTGVGTSTWYTYEELGVNGLIQNGKAPKIYIPAGVTAPEVAFNEDTYVNNYLDLIDALQLRSPVPALNKDQRELSKQHYNGYGKNEGRKIDARFPKPIPITGVPEDFDAAQYMSNYQDLQQIHASSPEPKRSMDLANHYKYFGRKENRSYKPIPGAAGNAGAGTGAAGTNTGSGTNGAAGNGGAGENTGGSSSAPPVTVLSKSAFSTTFTLAPGVTLSETKGGNNIKDAAFGRYACVYGIQSGNDAQAVMGYVQDGICLGAGARGIQKVAIGQGASYVSVTGANWMNRSAVQAFDQTALFTNNANAPLSTGLGIKNGFFGKTLPKHSTDSGTIAYANGETPTFAPLGNDDKVYVLSASQPAPAQKIVSTLNKDGLNFNLSQGLSLVSDLNSSTALKNGANKKVCVGYHKYSDFAKVLRFGFVTASNTCAIAALNTQPKAFGSGDAYVLEMNGNWVDVRDQRAIDYMNRGQSLINDPANNGFLAEINGSGIGMYYPDTPTSTLVYSRDDSGAGVIEVYASQAVKIYVPNS